MARIYKIRASIAFDDVYYGDGAKSTVVHIEDGSPVNTGILNAEGNEIFRYEIPNPIGFQSSRSE